MSAPGTRTPLFPDSAERIDELEGSSGSKSKLTTFAERLGLKADALSDSSKENAPVRTVRGHEQSVVTISQDQLEDLVTALENTTDMIKQLNMNSTEIMRRRRNHRIPKWITRNLLILTIFWQVMNIAIVTVIEAFKNQSDKKDAKMDNAIFVGSVIVIVVFQAANLVLVFFTTIKLTKQIQHQTVTKSFLGQSFLCTTLLYAGLYMLIHKIDSDAFKYIHDIIKKPETPLLTPLVYLMMFFYSVSTATLCGGSLIVPVVWTAQLISSTQMLMSYVYFASVLYMAVQPRKNEMKLKVVQGSLNMNGASGHYGSV